MSQLDAVIMINLWMSLPKEPLFVFVPLEGYSDWTHHTESTLYRENVPGFTRGLILELKLVLVT